MSLQSLLDGSSAFLWLWWHWHLEGSRPSTLLTVLRLCLSGVSINFQVMYFWWEYYRSGIVFSMDHTKRLIMLVYSIVGGVNYLAKVLITRFLHFQITIPPFVIFNWFMGIYSETITLLFLINLSLTDLIWWCVFPEKWLLWCKMVIFLIPSFLLHLLALYYYLWTRGTMLHSVSYNPLLLWNVLVLKLCQIFEVQVPSIWPVYLLYDTLSQNGLSDSLL